MKNRVLRWTSCRWISLQKARRRRLSLLAVSVSVQLIFQNNAGICKLNKVLDFGRADWDPMIDVNLTAAFELSYEAAKIMIPQKKSGKIINICSLFSYLGGQWSPPHILPLNMLLPGSPAYCDELGQYNIQVNGIAQLLCNRYYAGDTQ